LIITVFDIFGAPNATVVSDGVDAIFGHAATPELNRAAPSKSTGVGKCVNCGWTVILAIHLWIA
jgi:hypothetical protein